jgi:tRNA/tmRNA/rRNA uracil-C5-methylase (TrmA/RlmC/RlmD family)
MTSNEEWIEITREKKKKNNYFLKSNSDNSISIIKEDHIEIKNINPEFTVISSSQNIEDLSDELSENDKKYVKPKILNHVILENFFSDEDIKTSILNNKKLQITDKGLYSISRDEDAKWITNIILNFIRNKDLDNPPLNIIDSTAGIGGNTIHFSKYFNKVKAIEINSVHYEVLKNNIDALNIKNVELCFDNFMNQLKNEKKDSIFFLDPPWGGKSYKSFKYFCLKIGKLPLHSVLNILYENNYKYVVLKAPYNLNISLLVDNVNYENMNVYKSKKKNMLIVIFYN